MIGACESFGSPFLLKKSPGRGFGKCSSREVVEVKFIPTLTEFLGMSSVFLLNGNIFKHN